MTRIKGLYAVTPDIAGTALLLSKVEAALTGGVRRQLHVTLVAVAGLNLGDPRAVVAAGADAIGAISAMFGAGDAATAARENGDIYRT